MDPRAPAEAPGGRPDLFKRLGLHGLEGIAPVLVAALATEEPLLLIGPHGTAKSLLLTRVAEALGLEFRHYNASLLSFDDLVGFPLPGKDGRLDYVTTPATVWGAGAVIFDEISRCRPEVQNKLFPIIHERKVQGLTIETLRYRWAAMNPPSTEDDDNGYLGSEPLDAALADRFAFVIEMPPWSGLSEAEQLAIIRAEAAPLTPDAVHGLGDALVRTRTILPSISASLSDGIASYTRALVALLVEANVALSPRRAGMLFRSALAVNAACMAIDPAIAASEATLLAVRNALPQPARGIAVPPLKLLAAHRDAWRLASINPGDPLKAILCAGTPIERFKLAVAAPGLDKGDFSRVVADVLAQLPKGGREAAIVHLFETGAVGRLNAAVAGGAAEIYRDIAKPPGFTEGLHPSNPRFQAWSKLKDLMSRLDPREPRAHLRANAMAASFARGELSTPTDAEAAFQAFAAIEAQLGRMP
jgi:MoxR-like ATPase